MLSKATIGYRGSSHSQIFDSSLIPSVLMPFTKHFHMGLLKFVQGLSKTTDGSPKDSWNTKARENPVVYKFVPNNSLWCEKQQSQTEYNSFIPYKKSSELGIKVFYCVFVRTEINLIAFSGPRNCVNTQPYLEPCFMINLQESMGPGRDKTRDPWICSHTRICCQTHYATR